jgi:hypothetical protein
MEALDILAFTPNKAAEPVQKLIRSAIANAEENFGVARNDLYVYRSTPMKHPHGNGGGLVPVDGSNRYCGVDRTSQSF